MLGSGWLGEALSHCLASLDYQIKLSTRSIQRFEQLKSKNIHPFIVDIEKPQDYDESFLDIDCLIINITSKNITGFKQLITKIENSAIKKVIFVSSTSVYNNTNDWVKESDNVELPESALFQIENLFRYNSHFQTTIVRLAGLIGYNRHPGRFFRGGKKVQQPDAPVNLVHRDDCITIIRHIIQQEVWGEVFNVCADTHPTKREFYSYASQLLGRGEPEFLIPEKNYLKLFQIPK